MTNVRRFRCPTCGSCYEMSPSQRPTDTVVCNLCQLSTTLLPESPHGFMDGKYPPLLVLIGLIGTLITVILGLAIHPLVLCIAIPTLTFLLAERIQTQERYRKERMASWHQLRVTYTDLVETKSKLSDITEKLGQATARYDRIAPERRDRLAVEIRKQQEALGVLGELSVLKEEKEKLQTIIAELKSRIISFEEEEALQSFGFYKPLYDCADSEEYRRLLEQIREKQKEMVREKEAVRVDRRVRLGNDNADEKKASKNLEKLILRAFNNECDATIDKVTFSNLDAITLRIKKSCQDLNEICETVGVSIAQTYLNQKIEELHLCYEYQVKLKDEKEEQRKIREEMRDQARLMKEIEDARKKIEKEEDHFTQAIAEVRSRMEAASLEQKELYEKKLRELEEQLADVEKDKAEVEYREKSTRAGYVYIISNIGSFGDGVYKIGVTRRLDPQERIDELGDASVPFEFDVHAMIFSEDAPSLETALHQHFADRAVNRVNARKEFFRVSLGEVEEVVKENHNRVVEFTRIARAEDFRLTLAMDGKHAQIAGNSDESQQ